MPAKKTTPPTAPPAAPALGAGQGGSKQSLAVRGSVNDAHGVGARPERVMKGLPVSPGIVIGTVLILDGDELKVARRTVALAQVAEEVARLERAIKAAIADIDAAHAKAEKEMGKETAQIFRVHAMMLKDPSLVGPMKKLIQKEAVTADYAACSTLATLAAQFRGIKDSAFATKVNDIDDLALRLHRHLVGEQRSRLASAARGSVVLAKDLTPSQAAGFDRSRISAFATDLGGLTSHTAIIAKALEIPAVVGVQTMLRGGGAVDGAACIIDGDTGTVILDPTPATLEQYRLAIEQRTLYRTGLEDVVGLPCVTLDGVHIDILGNIELPDEVEKVMKFGGVGIGLYRSEYLWLTMNREPTEGEQFAAYKRCVELCKGRECTIRTCDLGADKLTQSLEETPERNPFLGNRSIRYCLRNVPMFKRQLRAILRASAFGPVKLMFPLVTCTHELRQAKFILNDVMEELSEEKIAFDPKIQVGMMVEVPSAALQAETFAREVDFFSIGTNDLIQYTLAVDRINERVAALYQATHPAVVRLIRDVARAARHRRIPVSCCGESAADVEYAMLLLGMGLRTLSVSGSTIPQLKRFIRSVTIKQCQRVAREALSLDSDVQVAALLRDRARKIVPEAFSGRAAE